MCGSAFDVSIRMFKECVHPLGQCGIGVLNTRYCDDDDEEEEEEEEEEAERKLPCLHQARCAVPDVP